MARSSVPTVPVVCSASLTRKVNPGCLLGSSLLGGGIVIGVDEAGPALLDAEGEVEYRGDPEVSAGRIRPCRTGSPGRGCPSRTHALAPAPGPAGTGRS